MLKPLAVLLAAAVALVALASPAEAATAVRPVTVTASSACVQYSWTVTVTVTSTRARVVDLYDSSDYGNRALAEAVALRAGVAWRITYRPGASAQYAEIGVFPVGSGGWDGDADPLVWTTVRDPIQTDPHALC
jgi:hypothetical protein